MFGSHGEFGITLHNNIFVADIRGAWNLETAKAYGEEATKVVMPILGAPWAQITVITDWELLTADAIPHMVELFRRANANGLVAEAIINTSDGLIKNELFNHSLKVALDGFERRVFSNHEDAVNWLESIGFPARSFQRWDDMTVCQR